MVNLPLMMISRTDSGLMLLVIISISKCFHLQCPGVYLLLDSDSRESAARVKRHLRSFT